MEITMAIILSVIALISPSITQAIKSHYDLKLAKIENYEKAKKDILKNFIKCSQAYSIDNTNDENFSNYVESVLNLYGYFDNIDDDLVRELTLSFSKSHSLQTFNLLSNLVSNLSKQISKK